MAQSPRHQRRAILAGKAMQVHEDWEKTYELAEQHGQRWGPDEDGYLLLHRRDLDVDTALALGRTVFAARSRRHALKLAMQVAVRARLHADRAAGIKVPATEWA